LCVVYDMFTDESLNNFVISLVSLPTYVNFAHFFPFPPCFLGFLEVYSLQIGHICFSVKFV